MTQQIKLFVISCTMSQTWTKENFRTFILYNSKKFPHGIRRELRGENCSSDYIFQCSKISLKQHICLIYSSEIFLSSSYSQTSRPISASFCNVCSVFECPWGSTIEEKFSFVIRLLKLPTVPATFVLPYKRNDKIRFDSVRKLFHI